MTRFIEEPAAEAAQGAGATPGCLWNSGLFLMRGRQPGGRVLERHEPAVLAAADGLRSGRARPTRTSCGLDAGVAPGQAPKISIDHAVMERTANAAVVAADFPWSDIGSWSSVWEAQARDGERQRQVRGQTWCLNEAQRLRCVFTEGPTIAAHGISDLIIVATADRVLVVPMLDDQHVRDLADEADGV